jgi:hypothetical protein
LRGGAGRRRDRAGGHVRHPRSLPYETGVDLDGYVWGVKWHCLYPGAQVVDESPSARNWAEAIGIEFHEVRIESNAHDLTLIFSDLQVSELPPGYRPFVTGEDVQPRADAATGINDSLPGAPRHTRRSSARLRPALVPTAPRHTAMP